MIFHLQILLLIVVLIFHYDMGAEVFNCPTDQTKFEKLIGLRPDPLENSSLIYKGRTNAPVTLDCLQICVQSTDCSSFLLNYNKSECYSYNADTTRHIQNYDYDSRPDTNVVWFRKTCLSDNILNCNSKAWSFEIIAGADFIGYNTRNLGSKTRSECIDSCAKETTFICRSIKFFAVNTSEIDPLGSCTLSNMDRHLLPGSFRVSRYENEYIENQCVNTSSREFCSYEEYENSTLQHADLIVTLPTKEECRKTCDNLPSFNCRGYSIVSVRNDGENRQSFTCLLHSEDTKLVGPKLLVNQPGATYYERARCLNISVSCTDNFMTITYVPEQPFTGRIYANGFSDKVPCYADGKYNESVLLKIPLNSCGVSDSQPTTTSNRTLRSVSLVIQYNALIQTQIDRYIKVGCANGDEPEEITLGTNVNFTNSNPNRGSTVINNSSVLPTVTIRVVDYNTKKPTRDTEIGQQLQLIIEIKPGNGPYDIWAGHLVATSDNGQDSILLLDDNGCPTQLEIFPSFTKILTSDSRMLVSTFQAFKFTSSTVVRFSVMVHFCTLTCPPIDCPTYSRAKREASYGYDIHSSNATVLPINKTNTIILEEMPLDVLLIVRGSITQSDQLVIGNNKKILIAGTDWITNQVCVDYALFLGLGIIWIILQIIIIVCCFLLIRKYKKYFDIAYTRQMDEQQYGLGDTHQGFGLGGENLSRRVRWADQ